MFLLVTFGRKNGYLWYSNDSLKNQWMWLINYAATKVKSVDKNCPPLKFVGQHGVSYLGHKRPKMLKNSEWQACRVDTILGQCDDDYLLQWSSQVMMMMFIFYIGLRRWWWWHTVPEGGQPDKLATLSFSAFLVVCDQDRKPHVGQQIL